MVDRFPDDTAVSPRRVPAVVPVSRPTPRGKGFLLVLLAVLACGGCARAPATDAEAFLDWSRDHLIATGSLTLVTGETLETSSAGAHEVWTWDDRQALNTALGGAELVGLGDSRHDTREQHLVKAALARFLIEELGFGIVVIEGSFTQMEAVDRCLGPEGGDLPSAVSSLPGWYLWDTGEMLDFLEWIRGFNATHPAAERVHVFGMDITAPAAGIREVVDALRVEETVEGEEGSAPVTIREEDLGLDLQDGDFWPRTWQRYRELDETRRQGLATAYQALVDKVEARKERLVSAFTTTEYERLLLLARIGAWGNGLFSSMNPAEGGVIRERGMAEVLAWIRAHEGPAAKVVVWANNLHVATAPFEMPGLAEGKLVPMGVLLRERWGDAYLAIGGSFGEGSFGPELPPGERSFEPAPPESMDGALARVGPSAFLLDLRAVRIDAGAREAPVASRDISGAARDARAARWLGEARRWRSQDGWAVMVPAEAFDLVYFVRQITRARPSARALERFRAMGE